MIQRFVGISFVIAFWGCAGRVQTVQSTETDGLTWVTLEHGFNEQSEGAFVFGVGRVDGTVNTALAREIAEDEARKNFRIAFDAYVQAFAPIPWPVVENTDKPDTAGEIAIFEIYAMPAVGVLDVQTEANFVAVRVGLNVEDFKLGLETADVPGRVRDYMLKNALTAHGRAAADHPKITP